MCGSIPCAVCQQQAHSSCILVHLLTSANWCCNSSGWKQKVPQQDILCLLLPTVTMPYKPQLLLFGWKAARTQGTVCLLWCRVLEGLIANMMNKQAPPTPNPWKLVHWHFGLTLPESQELAYAWCCWLIWTISFPAKFTLSLSNSFSYSPIFVCMFRVPSTKGEVTFLSSNFLQQNPAIIKRKESYLKCHSQSNHFCAVITQLLLDHN